MGRKVKTAWTAREVSELLEPGVRGAFGPRVEVWAENDGSVVVATGWAFFVLTPAEILSGEWKAAARTGMLYLRGERKEARERWRSDRDDDQERGV